MKPVTVQKVNTEIVRAANVKLVTRL